MQVNRFHSTDNHPDDSPSREVRFMDLQCGFPLTAGPQDYRPIGGGYAAPITRLMRRLNSPDGALGSFMKSTNGVARGPMMRYLQRLLLDGVEAAGPVPLDWPKRAQKREPTQRERCDSPRRALHEHDSSREWYEKKSEEKISHDISPSRRYAAELEAQIAEKKARERREKEEEVMRDRVLEEKVLRSR